MRPPLKGKRASARRLVDGVRRSVADVIAPPQRPAAEPPELAVTAPREDTDARFDAARERLRSTVPPPDDESAEP